MLCKHDFFLLEIKYLLMVIRHFQKRLAVRYSAKDDIPRSRLKGPFVYIYLLYACMIV